MIRSYLWPTIKRFKGLFISMAFISMLSLALLISFASSIMRFSAAYEEFKNQYGSPSAGFEIALKLKSELGDIKNDVPGIAQIEERIEFSTYIKKEDGRNIVARFMTYDEQEQGIVKLYDIEKVPDSTTEINLAITQKFANNNGFKVGDTITLSMLSVNFKAHISRIVETPTSCFVRVSPYVWSDTYDFGHAYVKQNEMQDLLIEVVEAIATDLIEHEGDEEYIEKKLEQINDALYSLNIDYESFAKMFTEEGITLNDYTDAILVVAGEGVDHVELKNKIENYLTLKNIRVNTSYVEEQTVYDIYMKNTQKQLKVVVYFLPAFFYIVTMLVISLFFSQIIKQMTPEIGTMVSLGISQKSITGLLSICSLIVTAVAVITGVGLSVGLSAMLVSIFKTTYSIPLFNLTINPLVVVLGGLGLFIIAQIAVLISSRAIFRITPKDAMISNESKRKRLPKRVENFIDKAPMNIKLSSNSILQNPRRFLIATFSMIASFTIIVVTLLFFNSIQTLKAQTTSFRLSYDAQVYLTNKEDDDTLLNTLRKSESTKSVISGGFTYANLSYNGNEAITCITALNPNDQELVTIPGEDPNVRTYVDEEGIILPTKIMSQLGVNVGDTITINNVPIKVSAKSNQYYNVVSYLSINNMNNLGMTYVTTYFANVNDQNGFINVVTSNNMAAVTVFSTGLQKEMNMTFGAINTFIYILIGFSFAMGLIILAIMSLNALIEQKRQLSILRCVGFTTGNISTIWGFQSILELILSLIIAIPASALITMLLFRVASTTIITYPFIFSIPVLAIAFGFIVISILGAHAIALLSLRKWNLADNTRSRE